MKITAETTRQALTTRMVTCAEYVARDRGYSVRGVRAIHCLAAARGVALFQLTRGCVVVAVDGMDQRSEWYALLDEGKVALDSALQATGLDMSCSVRQESTPTKTGA